MYKLFKYFLLLFTVLYIPKQLSGQDSLDHKINTTQRISQISKGLEQSYSTKDETSTAKNYEKLATVYSEKEEYTKAEDCLKKALAIYTKLNLRKEKERVGRSLAKTQEQLGKYEDAIKNYDLIKNESKDKRQNK